ncbi:MAG: PLP-dependent cysteine synthase family protein [Bacilli bacterium]
MSSYPKILDYIGNTPLIELTQFDLPECVKIYAKLEFMNPGGSVKDRLGIHLLENAFQTGDLKYESTILEVTAGNTGIGIALAAKKYHIPCVFFIPENFSVEKQILLRSLGAKVVLTPASLGIDGAHQALEKDRVNYEHVYVPGQFHSLENPNTYALSIGPEIFNQLDGKLDFFVAGAGSGGTFSGCVRYLKDRIPWLYNVIVEPEGSILNGGQPHPHRTEGIGMSTLSKFLDFQYIDQIETIPDDEAFFYTRALAAREGLFVGSSSGAAMAACIRLTKQIKRGNIVVIFPDRSDRYFSSQIYEEGDSHSNQDEIHPRHFNH